MDDDVNLSPEDIAKIKRAQELVAQANNLLEEIPEDVREEIGDLEDALSKLDEVSELLMGIPNGEEGATSDNPT